MTAVSLFDQPRWHNSDPYTSREAALVMAGQRGELERLIRCEVDAFGPCSQEEIAAHVLAVFPDRWAVGSIVTACKRAHLRPAGEGRNRRGHKVLLWECGPIPAQVIEVAGDVL